jgi:small-conductance mechanosensitive channel
MFSFFFYVFLFVTIVAIMGLDPFVMIASFSGFIVGFAFMINIACSSWVQGVLLILVRRPYDIGDRYDCRCVTVCFTVCLVRVRLMQALCHQDTHQ